MPSHVASVATVAIEFERPPPTPAAADIPGPVPPPGSRGPPRAGGALPFEWRLALHTACDTLTERDAQVVTRTIDIAARYRRTGRTLVGAGPPPCGARPRAQNRAPISRARWRGSRRARPRPWRSRWRF